LSILVDDLDVIGENHTFDELWQLLMTIKSVPTFLGGLYELEHHGQRRLVGQAAFGSKLAVRERVCTNDVFPLVTKEESCQVLKWQCCCGRSPDQNYDVSSSSLIGLSCRRLPLSLSDLRTPESIRSAPSRVRTF
jgi:hypothetical protein